MNVRTFIEIGLRKGISDFSVGQSPSLINPDLTQVSSAAAVKVGAVIGEEEPLPDKDVNGCYISGLAMKLDGAGSMEILNVLRQLESQLTKKGFPTVTITVEGVAARAQLLRLSLGRQALSGEGEQLLFRVGFSPFGEGDWNDKLSWVREKVAELTSAQSQVVETRQQEDEVRLDTEEAEKAAEPQILRVENIARLGGAELDTTANVWKRPLLMWLSDAAEGAMVQFSIKDLPGICLLRKTGTATCAGAINTTD